MKKAVLLTLILSLLFLSCSCGEIKAIGADVPESAAIQNFLEYLDGTNTTGFIIQKDNKIILEKYWGNGKNKSSNKASAGKSIVI